MFQVFSSYFSEDIGIDLGTANTVIFVKGRGIVLSEPSVVAIKSDSKNCHRIVAVGTRAKKMIGRAPDCIVATHPLKDGVIADFELTDAMLKHFILKARKRPFLAKPKIVICLPSGSSEVEMLAVRQAANNVGARAVYLLAEPVAAAIGNNLPVKEPTGTMIVDIGGGTTEVAVLAMSDIVHSSSIRIAGHEMDNAIIKHVKAKYGLLIGARTAEAVKKRVGNACCDNDGRSVEVKGRDLIGGVPKVVTLRSTEVAEAISRPVRAIVETIKNALMHIPPDLASDIVERGIVLSGGGSLLRNLDGVIRTATGLPVVLADNPLLSVVLGTKAILEKPHLYEDLLIHRR